MPHNGMLDPQYVALNERVTNQGQQIQAIDNKVTSLETEMRRGFGDVVVALNSSKDDASRNLASLREDIISSRKIQWPAISVGVFIFVALVGLGYLPIKQEQDRTRADIADLQKGPTRDETEAWRRRTSEDRDRIEETVADLRRSSVPRGEYLEGRAGINQGIADLARRVEDVRGQMGATYGVRDVIQRLEQRLDMMEQKRDQ